MKKVEAIIRKDKLERVKMLLATFGYYSVTIAEVSGLGRQEGISSKWGSNECKMRFLPKVKIELVINDEDVSPVSSAIVRGAKTGEMGDGNILIIPIDNAIRVRTGDLSIKAR